MSSQPTLTIRCRCVRADRLLVGGQLEHVVYTDIEGLCENNFSSSWL